MGVSLLIIFLSTHTRIIIVLYFVITRILVLCRQHDDITYMFCVAGGPTAKSGVLLFSVDRIRGPSTVSSLTTKNNQTLLIV